MIGMPKVTVLMPSYNVFDYIEQSVRSVMAQTLKDIEILCIDAGSGDGTEEVLLKLSKDDPRIRVITSDVKSYGHQMNLGIREAKGEYIGIVETDDYVDPDMFERLYAAAIKNNADVSKAVFYELYEYDGNKVEIPADFIADDHEPGMAFLPDNVPSVQFWDGNIWNGIYRRSFLIDKGILFRETPGAAFQDIGFKHLVLNEASSVIFMHSHFYHYRKVRPGASTWNPKCVRFIYGEYRELFECGRIREGHAKHIYLRMINAFLYELEKALCYGNFDIEKLECIEAVDWFINTVKQGLDDGIIRPDELKDQDRKDIQALLADRFAYSDRVKDRCQPLYDWFKSIKRKVAGKPVVVFGAGRYGLMIVRFFLRNGIQVAGIADNDRGLNIRSYYGLQVMSADDTERYHKDAFFLIASKRYGEKIMRQLERCGVSREDMYVFNGEDKTVCDRLERAPILVPEI